MAVPRNTEKHPDGITGYEATYRDEFHPSFFERRFESRIDALVVERGIYHQEPGAKNAGHQTCVVPGSTGYCPTYHSKSKTTFDHGERGTSDVKSHRLVRW